MPRCWEPAINTEPAVNTELWDMLCEEEEVLSFDFENVTLCNEFGGDGANEMKYFV